MKLFFDTETTDQADYKSDPAAPHQPRMVSIAAVLTSDCVQYEYSSIRLVVRPGYDSKPGALRVHKITKAVADTIGVPLLTALSAFYNLAGRADTLIAYNIAFDRLILTGEFKRANKGDPFAVKKCECEMLAMMPICQIPKRSSLNDDEYKWPSLTEAHEHAFCKGIDGAHDAMTDVRALIAVHRWRLQQTPNPVPV